MHKFFLPVLFLLGGCRAASFVDTPDMTVEGTPTSTSYQAGDVTANSLSQAWPTHAIVDGEAADVFSQLPIAQIGSAEGRIFLQSPSDVEGKGWSIEMGEHGLRKLDLQEIHISKSDPLVASAEIVTALAPVVKSAVEEVNETNRQQWEQFWEGFPSVMESAVEAALRRAAPTP